MDELKEYASNVILVFEGNHHEASSVKDYKDKLKLQYKEMYNIYLVDSEIQDVEELRKDKAWVVL